MSKDTGFKLMERAKEFNFMKWGHYMKRAQLAERKVEKLKRLILLTDASVSDVEMSYVTARQWVEFVKTFPEEAPE